MGDSIDVRNFIESKTPIQVSVPVPEGTLLCFVDASFNPPNFAHAKLVELCLEEFPDCIVVLQLAIGNADKPAAPVEQLQARADMMSILAQIEFGSLQSRVAVGLTTAAQFSEKAVLAQAAFPTSKIVFAMGYDTLIRVGDQRYYEEPVQDVLARLFTATEVVLLTRDSDGVSHLPQGMIQAALQRKALEESPLFSSYMKRIHLFEAVPETTEVSSSHARSSLKHLHRCVPASVVDYIRRNGLYQDYSSDER